MPVEYQGCVFTGLGISAILCRLNMEVYQQSTGMNLVPGTLNIRLTKDFDIPEKAIYIGPEKIKPLEKHRSVKLIPAVMFREKVFIILPENSGYEKNVIEILAPFYLRQKFNIKDGDLVTILV